MAVDAEHTVTIAAPLDQVLAVIRDVPGQPSWWPGLRRTEVLEEDDQGRALRARVASDVKVVTDTFEVVYSHTDTGVTWQLDGTSLAQRRQSGAWSVRDHPEGSEATLRLEIEATLPLPKLVQRRIVRDTVTGAVAGLKARCER